MLQINTSTNPQLFRNGALDMTPPLMERLFCNGCGPSPPPPHDYSVPNLQHSVAVGFKGGDAKVIHHS